MSLLFARDVSLQALGVPSRSGRSHGSVPVTPATALQHSAVWAALRLRANLVSSLPVDVYRSSGGGQAPVTTPERLVRPGALFLGGPLVTVDEWLYATQVDLDRDGNTFGIVVARDALQLPTRIDLTPVSEWSVSVRDGQAVYRHRGERVPEVDVWHERQYPVPGLPVGLSPLAVAAMAIGQYLSAQQFALDWFGNSAVPASRLKNTERTVTADKAEEIKARFKSSVRAGDVFVHGSDWDFEMIAAQASQSEFLSTQKFSIGDVARFFDVPGDMIDAESSTGHITYANVVQRNVQLLVTALGPAVKRRETRLGQMLPKPQTVKLNTDALLRMDPNTRAETLAIGVANRAVTPNEWRALDDRPPLTPEQEAEFARLFPTRSVDTAPVAKG